MPSFSTHPHPEPGAHSFAPEPPSHLLAPFEQLFQRLANTAVHVGEGFALGLLLAPIVRARHLHWSWPAAATALVVSVGGSLGPLAPTLATAALTITVRNRRWHREDLEAGADLAEAARERHTPLDSLRAALRRLGELNLGALFGPLRPLRRRRPNALEVATYAGVDIREEAPWWRRALAGSSPRPVPSELIVGVDRSSRPISIPLRDGSGGVHTLVVGATGSGKTVTQTAIAVAAAQREMAVIVIDPKEDSHMRSELERAARIAGRPFVEWTPEGPSVYNPFAHGAPTEIVDRALAGEHYTEPHYLRQAQRYLGHAVRTLRHREREVSLAELVRQLDPDELEVLARSLPESRSREVCDYLGSLNPRQLTDLSGVRDRLAIMAESDIGPWLDPRTEGAPVFELPGALRERAVLYFGLRADQRPLLAQMLAAAIVQDLQSAIAGLQCAPIPSLVAIDEFSALGAEHVARLFGRARSAGMSLLLGTQEFSDLRIPGQERLLEQILGNLSTLIAHRQVVPDSAELVARLAGTRGAWSTSINSSGQRTRTRVREFLFHPHYLTEMPRGCAAVLALTGGPAQVSIARMRPPQR
ncbi:MAG: type IV secretion system DNA-binding domain-containing protein [Solirubrobacterales bacterium]